MNEAQALPARLIARIRARNPRILPVLSGAIAIAAFSVLGGACTATPATVGGAPSTGHAPAVPAVPVLPNMTLLLPPQPPPPTPVSAAPKPPAHIVIVVEENESPKLLSPQAPYIASLERRGANFTNAYAETHPSQPNYLALFSGSTHGVTTDGCPQSFPNANLASQITKAGGTFTGYAESLPSRGYTGCRSGTFARKHTPWMDFTNVPKADSASLATFPQADFNALPTISVVIPDMCDDMHDCSVAIGDAWLRANMSAYATWAKTHNSLLIVTFDEADEPVNGTAVGPNRIPLVLFGQPVTPGTYTQKVNHYSVLRTIENLYGLHCLGGACTAKPLTAALAENVSKA